MENLNGTAHSRPICKACKNIACDNCYLLTALEDARLQYEMLHEGERSAKKIELKSEGKFDVDFTLESFTWN